MLTTSYALPFTFEAPAVNPWDGRDRVEVRIAASQPLSEHDSETLQNYIFPFWLLASGGGLAGDFVPPERSTCEQPTFSASGDSGLFVFDPCELDERASSCLLCLVLAAHREVPLAHVSVHVAGAPLLPVAIDPHLDNPYPCMPTGLPFTAAIEDSESDVRVLRVTWAKPLSPTQREEVESELGGFGAALLAGAFGVPPIPPAECDCRPEQHAEWVNREMTWVLENCRFHWAALECLVALCVALADRIGPISEVKVE